MKCIILRCSGMFAGPDCVIVASVGELRHLSDRVRKIWEKAHAGDGLVGMMSIIMPTPIALSLQKAARVLGELGIDLDLALFHEHDFLILEVPEPDARSLTDVGLNLARASLRYDDDGCYTVALEHAGGGQILGRFAYEDLGDAEPVALRQFRVTVDVERKERAEVVVCVAARSEREAAEVVARKVSMMADHDPEAFDWRGCLEGVRVMPVCQVKEDLPTTEETAR